MNYFLLSFCLLNGGGGETIFVMFAFFFSKYGIMEYILRSFESFYTINITKLI